MSASRVVARLPVQMHPAIRRVEYRQHGAGLGTLAHFATASQHHTLATDARRHTDENELSLERINELRALQRERSLSARSALHRFDDRQQGCTRREVDARPFR